MPRMENAKGEALYYNVVEKNGKVQYVLKGIGSTLILGRDKQKRSPAFSPRKPRSSSTSGGTVSRLHTESNTPDGDGPTKGSVAAFLSSP